MLIVCVGKWIDIDVLIKLVVEVGIGFISLVFFLEVLEEKFIKLEKVFGLFGVEQMEDVYQLMLEDMEMGQIVGCFVVKVMIGVFKFYWDFKIIIFVQYFIEVDCCFDMDVLFLVNDFVGVMEVGILFVFEVGCGSGVGCFVV